jgi:Cu(I)/Ag(I) efflux system membrane fusion protein
MTMSKARKTHLAGFAAVVLAAGSAWVACRAPATSSPAAARASAKAAARYHCPMHPTFVAERPGACPICGMTLTPLAEDSPDAGTGERGAPEGVPADRASLELTPRRRKLLGLQSEPVVSAELQRTIRTVGRVTTDERRVHHIHTKVEAYVESLDVDFVGRFVKRGEVLASLYSPELLATQQEYLLAVRAQRQLAGSGVESVRQGASDLLAAARQRLLLWDIRPADIERLERGGEPRRTLELYAPASGYVTAKMAVAGMRVTPADTLFDIANLSRVWVMADVYESDLPGIQPGIRAELSLAYLPGRSWSGTVEYIAPTVDEATRTIKARVEVANPDGALKPGMFGDVRLEVGLGRGLVAPESALLVSGTRTLAFVDRDGRVEPRELTVGARVSGGVQVLRGLSEGERVVISASFLLDSESSLKAALAALGPPAGAAPAR